MIWIHGGAFKHGAGSLKKYDGKTLSEKNTIVVSINYRLGPLGFLPHDAFGTLALNGLND